MLGNNPQLTISKSFSFSTGDKTGSKINRRERPTKSRMPTLIGEVGQGLFFITSIRDSIGVSWLLICGSWRVIARSWGTICWCRGGRWSTVSSIRSVIMSMCSISFLKLFYFGRVGAIFPQNISFNERWCLQDVEQLSCCEKRGAWRFGFSMKYWFCCAYANQLWSSHLNKLCPYKSLRDIGTNT